SRGALDGVHPGSDIEGQCRVILKHPAQSESVADVLPQGTGWSRWGLDSAVEYEAMPLVVIGEAIVLPDVRWIDGRAEEEFAYVIQRLGPGVGDAVISPPHRPPQQGDMKAVIVGVRQ